MTHQEAIELLPWYANSSLGEGERREVAAHLSSCAACAEELGQLRTIQVALKESAEEQPEPSPALLRRALADIDAIERGNAKPSALSARRFGEVFDRIADVLFGWCGPMPALARAMVAAQFALVIALGAFSYSLWENQYATQSGGQSVARDGSTIAIRFNQSITEAQMRRLLGEIHGGIVAGPSALGIYSVQVPIAPEKNDELEKLLQSLRGKRELIDYAEKSS